MFLETESPCKKTPISKRLRDQQDPNKLLAIWLPGPAGAGRRLSGEIGWEIFGKNLVLGLPVIGVIYKKNLAMRFARWKTGLLGNCEGSEVLVIAQGLMFGCLVGLRLTEF